MGAEPQPQSGLAMGQEYELTLVSDYVSDAIMRQALDGSILSWNKAAERIFGYESKEILGWPCWMLVPPEHRGDFRARLSLQEMAGQVRATEQLLLRKNGTLFTGSILTVPVCDREGGLVERCCIIHEKANTTQLGGSADEWRERYHGAIHASGQMLRDWNPEKDVITVAGDVDGILGKKGDELTDGLKAWVALVHPDDQGEFLRELNGVRERGGQYQIEYRLKKANDAFLIVREYGYPSINSQGHTVGVASVIMDITEQRTTADRLRHSQKMEAFGRLAGGVAHDFNNLLTVIAGYTEVIKEDFEESDRRRPLLQEIENAAHRATSLTGQLLSFSRQQNSRARNFNLNDVISDAGKMVRRLIGEHIKLELKPASDLWLIKGDRGQFEQVLINLAVNARDAMPKGGTLTIETRNLTVGSDHTEVRGVLMGDYVLLTVRDTGVGDEAAKVSAPHIDVLGGVGHGGNAGMATCMSIVQESGGQMLAVPHLTGEMELRIYLPRVLPEEKAGRILGGLVQKGGTETILLVEDDSTVRRLAAGVLAKLGYYVLEGENGESALNVALEDLDRRIDLLITDMVMPKMGGLDLAAELETHFPNMRFLFTSGYPTQVQDPTKGRGRKAAFIQKPFMPKALAARVRSLLDIRL